jgi:hypothetical protein
MTESFTEQANKWSPKVKTTPTTTLLNSLESREQRPCSSSSSQITKIILLPLCGLPAEESCYQVSDQTVVVLWPASTPIVLFSKMLKFQRKEQKNLLRKK